MLLAAQPPEPRDPARVQPEREMMPEFLRMRLERMIRDSERVQREAKEALEKLDKGVSPEEVVRTSRLPMPRPFRGSWDNAAGDGSRREGPRGDDARGADGRTPLDAPRTGRPPGHGQRGERRPGLDRERGTFPPPRPLNDEERQQVRVMLREIAPRLHDTIEEVRVRDERLATSMVERVAPMVRAVEGLRERDPKFFELRVGEMRSTIDVMRSVHEYRAASRSGKSGEELQTLLSGVRDAIARNFDDRLAIQRYEAEELAQRVESLRDEIDRATSDREQAIERGVERVRRDERPRGR